MNFLTKVAAAAALVLCVATVPARADVIFDFVGTGAGKADESVDPFRGLTASFQIVLTDEAYASGATLVRTDGRGSPSVTQLEGLKGLYTRVAFGGVVVNAGLDDYLSESRIGTGVYHSISLSVVPGGTPTGNLTFNDGGSDYSVNFSGTGVLGRAASDAGGGCYAGGGCMFSGYVVQSVPEPASLALFGVGLAGLGLIRRRRVR